MKKILSIVFAACLLAGCQCRQGSPAPAEESVTTEAASAPVFTAEPIPEAVEARMRGVSYPDDAEVKLEDLRYLRLSYVDFNGKEQVGEMICNKAIADDLVDIFRELFEARYPISRVRPAGASAYADRSKDFPHKIDKNDLCYRLFREHGFHWGGTWRSVQDYQHFEK